MAATDEEALEGFRVLCLSEGIIPALEPAHALGYLLARAGEWSAGLNRCREISGRGDKDVALYAEATGRDLDGGG